MSTAPIALSCGDPAGIGPELAWAAWQQLRDSVPFLWIGDPSHLPSDAIWNIVDAPHQAKALSTTALPVWPVPFARPVQPGTPDPANAQGVITAIETAVTLTRSGETSAICTAPISKKILIDGARFPHPGHTEFLATLAETEQVVMMLASPALRVVPATIHIPLTDVPKRLTPHLLRQVIEITHRGLIRDFGLTDPKLAVAGLNPHAGEGGALGREELLWINDLVASMASEGLRITGPLPADTMFHAAARARYDVAICMYHDQALIPIKTLDFDRGVNVTLGLPFIRTSPDHGTAFDIAGQGVANPTSLIEALKLAQQMAAARR
ncbi:MAG: 4-hydroxythreonine-4-phosphate dehydrogenase PdxA [Rhodobacteraceae bacterium]|nr:4-hydroxythreonine-4-phosphate dehydrogenase PdxA [Paracoccaceae bacterium]